MADLGREMAFRMDSFIREGLEPRDPIQPVREWAKKKLDETGG